MDCIHYDYPLLDTLLERWDSMTSTFDLPIGEMIVTIEEIHRLYHLLVHDRRV